MSNYLRYLLLKKPDTTDPNKPDKKFKPRFFHPIMAGGKDKKKKEDIEKHHIAHLYGVMMAQMLSEDSSIIVNIKTRATTIAQNARSVQFFKFFILQVIY